MQNKKHDKLLEVIIKFIEIDKRKFYQVPTRLEWK